MAAILDIWTMTPAWLRGYANGLRRAAAPQPLGSGVIQHPANSAALLREAEVAEGFADRLEGAASAAPPPALPAPAPIAAPADGWWWVEGLPRASGATTPAQVLHDLPAWRPVLLRCDGAAEPVHGVRNDRRHTAVFVSRAEAEAWITAQGGRVAEVASPVWTAERVELLRAAWGTKPRRALLAELNAMPGEPIASGDSVYQKARKLGLCQPAAQPIAQPAAQPVAQPAAQPAVPEDDILSTEDLHEARAMLRAGKGARELHEEFGAHPLEWWQAWCQRERAGRAA